MYNHQEIEKKWQEIWARERVYQTKTDQSKPKYYILDMFPYPSGAGLHVGHPKGYIATDILARLKMMQGFNVLHPMGFDAFGLPAENYAIKNKLHPKIATDENIATYKRQLSILGFSYDWDREVSTIDPEYYKWTQWIFLQMYKRGLAFESNEPINWCPSCKTGLANEDLEDGKCERCSTPVIQKPLRQWVLRITDYADRLLDDLDKLPGWEDSIKEMQRNWIGRSEGAEVDFKIKDSEQKIKVFTTRIDTIFGCTYIVVAPENSLVTELKEKIENWSEVALYIEECQSKTDLQRTDLNKEKTGVCLKGVKAINPFNQEEVDIFIADYVLNSYGTGAVMAVPAHDERDFAFAKKFGTRIKAVIFPDEQSEYEGKGAYIADGLLRNSGEFTGLSSPVARQEMIAYLEKNNLGAKKVNFKIKDWVFSRQRYWGEPIPLIHCPQCGVVPVPEEELPLLLPEVKSYEPTDTGESPLALISDWVQTTCPQCGGPAKRETNTMPQWAGSCWYYLRYIDPHNDQALVDKGLEKYWSPVDFYVGGAEHATRHLIYARFWHKFLFDIGVVNYEEPFTKLQHVGLIMGEDGRKMSKRWGNVINPDEIVSQYGADALRVYEMFMGPFDQACNWNTNGLIGVRKFLEKVYNLGELDNFQEVKEVKSLLHKTIKKVSADIESFCFNTAVSALMILVNEIVEVKNKISALPLTKEDFFKLLQILSPFAPHISEELAESLGYTGSIFASTWPQYDENLIKDEKINLVIQVNGKLRATLLASAEITEEAALELARQEKLVSKWLTDKEIVKVIFVPGKLLNIVVK
ncbi:leucine--tRNA ligase [Candidatus Falkowbacteria bacterium]|jgi:leucyl-tRNA synthetase|nr:leucine--tRNA ligase [Candidatus Falkowbacteria bacterium]